MVIYVLNTLIVPLNFDEGNEYRVRLKKINIEEAKRLLLSEGFESAVGHEGTAQLLSKILGIPIPFNRRTVFFKRGDKGIHFFLKQRLPEGTVLTEEQLKTLDYWLILSEVE
ncbi:MAG: DUF1874 domain-containing protein [Candidatus Nanoarchaeia archaeon]|nr:DUF1874 domain-containing protein [Candidatus Jingweiarchaeum tengchongense]